MSQMVVAASQAEPVTHAEWEALDSSIKEQALEIARSVNNAHKKIAHAKELARRAPNLKGGFLGIGRQKRINAAVAEAQIQTNEAVHDLAELIQQSIKFTLQSVRMASSMYRALSFIALHGIRDANGRVETLSNECTESINTIIEHARDFVLQQEQIMATQQELKAQLTEKVEQVDAELRDLIASHQQSHAEAHELLRKHMNQIRVTAGVACAISVTVAIAAIISALL